MRAVFPSHYNNEEMRHENKIKNKNHKMIYLEWWWYSWTDNDDEGKFYNLIYAMMIADCDVCNTEYDLNIINVISPLILSPFSSYDENHHQHHHHIYIIIIIIFFISSSILILASSSNHHHHRHNHHHHHHNYYHN